MKKWVPLALVALLVVAIVIAWKIFGPSVKEPESKYFYIPTGSVFGDVTAALLRQKIIRNKSWFDAVAKALKYKIIKPGKYEIGKGISLFNLVRTLKNGKQTPINLVIIKFRTKEEFAHRIGREFETDSLQMISFLNNNDSLKHYGLDTTSWYSAIIPDTYIYFWNSTPTKIFSKLYAVSQRFWTGEKVQKLKEKGLNPTQAYTLASIIEEETNSPADKEKIASVYINRLARGMPLQADPTIKFAMKDFELKRIYDKYLTAPSPYNTYMNKGLPPGPICTPSAETINAVIRAPKTDYVYFVANSDLNGGSVFSSTYEEHVKNARLYQQALNKQDSLRRARQTN